MSDTANVLCPPSNAICKLLPFTSEDFEVVAFVCEGACEWEIVCPMLSFLSSEDFVRTSSQSHQIVDCKQLRKYQEHI